MSLLRSAVLLLCVATAVDADLQLRSGKHHHKHHKRHESSEDGAMLLADNSYVSIPINQVAPSSAYAHPKHHHVKHVPAAAVASEPVPAAAVATAPVPAVKEPASAVASEP